MYVIAKENRPGKLTKGKKYEVNEEVRDMFRVISDDNKIHAFFKYRFYNCESCVERKCNSCEWNKIT
jgi:hypothetical protein